MKRCFYDIKGVTLVELIVSMAIFIFIIALMYPTFNLIRSQGTYIENIEALNERAQRLIKYMAEDIKMAGFVVGPKENIPYCSDSGVPVIQMETNGNTSNNPYDSLTFITSEPITFSLTQTCMNNKPDYWLHTSAEASAGDNIIPVENIPQTNCIHLVATNSATENAKSLIAFETASYVNNIYTIGNISTDRLTLFQGTSLQITVPSGARVYMVKQYRYEVDNRTLQRTSWRRDCVATGTAIDEANGELGGVDALQFEFLVYDAVNDTIVVQETPPADILSLRGIRIWILVRSDSRDNEYTDTNTYEVGTLQNGQPITNVVLGPYNDHFHRVLVNETVEVKNLGGL